MINRINKGILYSEDPIQKKKTDISIRLPIERKVPCKAHRFCFNELEKVFIEISNCKPESIFVFGVLQRGKINYEDGFKIYTDSDCRINDSVLEKNDDVCSEEYCAEILLPFTDAYFPNCPVHQFLSNTNFSEMNDFIARIKEQYPQSIIFLSQQENL